MKRTVVGIMLTLLLIGMLTLAFNIQPVKASGTIYIRADGSIDPPTAPISSVDNVTYTFTDNIYDEIVVERNNIVVDGAGYTVQGTGWGTGIYLSNRNNVTIQKVKIRKFSLGIFLSDYSSNNTLAGNEVTENRYWGIYLWPADNNTLVGNYIANNVVGIYLEYSDYNTLIGNNATANTYFGICLFRSSHNTLAGNNATANIGVFGHGINLFGSSYNTLAGNHIANNSVGISLRGNWVYYSSYNTFAGNNIANNGDGIRLEEYTSNNRIYHNNFINNTRQVYLTDSFNNTWDNGCEGNYWSDYNGTDSDGDGTGDTPYVIDGNNTDYYPLMNPYWLPGDVNHDLKINIYDVVMITGVYNSQQGDPNWNCHCDIAEPYGIINIYDVVTCTGQYGKEYTP